MKRDVNDAAALLATLRAAVDSHHSPDPATRQALAELDDPAALRTAGRILADLRPGDGQLRPVRMAVLATFTVGPFVHLLRAALVGAGALPSIDVGCYGAFEVSLATHAYAAGGDPDVVVCLLADSYFASADWRPTDIPALLAHLDAQATRLRDLILSSAECTTATLVVHTVPLPAELRDSVVAWRDRAAVAAGWHRMNAAILELAAAHPQVAVVDLVSLLADAPAAARDDRLHRYADLPYTDQTLALLAQQVRRVAQAPLGLSRRVLALDLDNTLWGGVVGEVGAEGVQLGGLYPGKCYTHLQRTAARLRDQGIVLVLASKNDADLVDRALAGNPEMVLRAEAFSARAVNWSPKAGNLRQMAATLGLSTGSFVFLDDSPFECGHVRAELPEVAVVCAPGDPAHLTRSLLRHGWFDTLDLTDADRHRPELYRARSLRVEHSAGYASTSDFLHTLAIEVSAAPVTGYTVPRVAQLAARTNQFNLTGVRFDTPTTATMAGSAHHMVAAFSVVDRFGDEGIVGAVWVDVAPPVWRIRNAVLSCRVLGRGIEFAIVEWVARQARVAGASRLAARFVPTDRNGAADGFLDKAGFAVGADGWAELDLADYSDNLPTWIKLREEQQ